MSVSAKQAVDKVIAEWDIPSLKNPHSDVWFNCCGTGEKQAKIITISGLSSSLAYFASEKKFLLVEVDPRSEQFLSQLQENMLYNLNSDFSMHMDVLRGWSSLLWADSHVLPLRFDPRINTSIHVNQVSKVVDYGRPVTGWDQCKLEERVRKVLDDLFDDCQKNNKKITVKEVKFLISTVTSGRGFYLVAYLKSLSLECLPKSLVPALLLAPPPLSPPPADDDKNEQSRALALREYGLNNIKLPMVPLYYTFQKRIRRLQSEAMLPESISKILGEGSCKEVIGANIKLPTWKGSYLFDVTKLQLLRLLTAGVVDLKNEKGEVLTRFVSVVGPHLDLLRGKRKAKRQKQEKKKEEDDEEKVSLPSCSVCCEHPSDTMLLPCTHQRTCKSCAEKVKICPTCRAKIESRIQPIL